MRTASFHTRSHLFERQPDVAKAQPRFLFKGSRRDFHRTLRRMANLAGDVAGGIPVWWNYDNVAEVRREWVSNSFDH